MSEWSQRKSFNNDGMDPDWKPTIPVETDGKVYVMFNLNKYVRVKLTNVGEAILRQEGRTGENRDEQGRVSFQMWDLIQLFGSQIGVGLPPPFDLNIELEVK